MNNERYRFLSVDRISPNKEFQKCVGRYGGDHYVKKFSCWDQFLSMAFAQLTYRDGLRDIESCLQAVGSKLYGSYLRHIYWRSAFDAKPTASRESRWWRPRLAASGRFSLPPPPVDDSSHR